MGKYFKSFATYADYENYISGGMVALPNISIIGNESGFCISRLLINAEDTIYVDGPASINVSCPERYNGEDIVLQVNGFEYTSTAVSGMASFSVTSGLTAGEKEFFAYVNSNRYIYGKSIFTVNKILLSLAASSIDIGIGPGRDKKESITVVGFAYDTTGKVYIITNNGGWWGDVVNSKAKIKIQVTTSGEPSYYTVSGSPQGEIAFVTIDGYNYCGSVDSNNQILISPMIVSETQDITLTIRYEGDDKYLPATTSTSFKVAVSSGGTPIS